MTEEIHATIKPFVMSFMQELMTNYYGPLYHHIKNHPELLETVPGFLLNPEMVIVYLGRTHVAVEYVGPEVIEELRPTGVLKLKFHDYAEEGSNLFEKIVGFEYDSTTDIKMPLLPESEGLLLPTNKGWDKLIELGWNFSAQNSVMGFNVPAPWPQENQFCRIVNGMFFDADDSGLKTRRIKWIDFFPIKYEEQNSEVDSISFNLKPVKNLVEHDANYTYPLPNDYKFKQLPKVNRFIELWGASETSEPDITSFLARPENQFILTMKFGAMGIHAERECEWQSEIKSGIRPDFFVVQPNGYADIVEFKLPKIGKPSIVGIENREAFAAWLNSYIAQTRTYVTYFDDPNNRAWVEAKYGIKVHKPRRWLVVGRRSDFGANVWREIAADYRDLEIITFDDLVDGVAVQFYKD